MSQPNFLRMTLCGIAALACAGQSIAAPPVATSSEAARLDSEAARLDSYVKADGSGYFALSLSPPAKLTPAAAHDIVVLFDTSASQTGEYRTKALAALDSLLASLGTKDRVHLMAADLKAVPLTPDFVPADSTEMHAAVEQLKHRAPLGSTDIGTVFQRVNEVYSAKSKNARAVVYIGDGMSTAGLLDTADFSALVAQLVKQRVPVTGYAIGPRLDAQLLAALANHTGGNLAVDSDEINGKQAGAFLAGAARGAVAWPIKVEWPKAFTAVYPKHALPLRSDRDTIVLGKGKASGHVAISMTVDAGGKPTKMDWTVEAKGSNNEYADLPAVVDAAKTDEGATLATLGTAGLQEMRRLCSNSADKLSTLGEQAAASGNLASAERLVAEALRRDPTDPTALQVKKQLQQIRKSGNSPKQLPSDLKLERVRNDQATPPASTAESAPQPSPFAPAPPATPRRVESKPAAPSRDRVPVDGDYLNEVERERQVKAGLIRVETQNALKDARARMATDPDGVQQGLKLALDRVQRAGELDLRKKTELRDQIEAALREANRLSYEKSIKEMDEIARVASARDRQRILANLTTKQEKMRQLVDRFDTLMQEAQYEAAEESAAGEMNVIAPELPITTSTTLIARTIRYTKDALDMRVKRQKGVVDQLAQCELSAQPFNDNRPIVYPDPEMWERITRDRKKFASVDLSEPQPAEIKIRKALDSPTSFDFAETPLQEAIEFLKEYHGIEIQFDLKALEEPAIVPAETTVNAALKGVSLRSGLKLLLSRVDDQLTFLIKDEVLMITTKTKADAQENFVRKVYPVADLVIPVKSQSFGGMGGGMMGGMMGGMGGGGMMGGMMGGMGGGGMMGGMMGGMGGGGMGGGFFSVPDPLPIPHASGLQAFAVTDDLTLKGKKSSASVPENPPARVAKPIPTAVTKPNAPQAKAADPATAKAAAEHAKPALDNGPIHLTVEEGSDLDTVWDEYFSTHAEISSAALVATARQLKKEQHFDQLIAMIRAALCHGQARPWMYESLGLAMQLVGSPPDELERTLMSAADLTDNPEQLMLLANYMSRNGLAERALKLYAQVSRLVPLRPEPYLFGLKLAEQIDNVPGIRWSSLGILKQEWPKNEQKIFQEAQNAAQAVVEKLNSEKRAAEAVAFQAQIKQALVRDIRVRVSWNGDADVDLLVQEPSGSVCSIRNARTTAGGVMLGDSAARSAETTSKGYSEFYVCPEAFSGTYQMLLKRVWGKITAGKVHVDVYSHVGTKQETHIRKEIPLGVQDAAVVFDLNDGRRTEPLAESQLANAVAVQMEVNRAILAQQLGALTDPNSDVSLINSRGGLAAANFPILQQAVGFMPVITVLPAGANMIATAVVSPDRRYVRVTALPLFSQIGQVTTFNIGSGATSTSQPTSGSGGSGIGGLPPIVPAAGNGNAGVAKNPANNPNPVGQAPVGNPFKKR